ncbi:poly-beta-1,6-N-acetyl-D-glucosamine synthase [Aggregatibacter actinomycetemcomitans]|uniref:Poly-beta-1,6-N-acetyl-D-glucosamine synthase n=1 Tax=Aggregatibacter actinomycetemcomitans serotype e str. SC1083 TaxID=907488 RepID=G4A8Y4_AGGAC|nr:poly-beta-1,6-N-acetyl-D-glucosamine synthase [Aggregatibacter actinomycetemcomitans]EGY33723.1 biofilm PGA synthesis N-glycosyltransferase PgaC [Aggregatibacter actinomycetemcomitans serotype e str. SC1083]EHK91565.1 N-glycosyltransferase [Aggregatibacter actinomycetemcomitans RhAA1]KNE78575.1 N-glycosyltransferase [Aggregatibacter actinomycetemcomitans RhAA1]KYK76296.1 N-glycosyltransferase [Aggregatibacter actinomycetemcomitans serotype e str. SA3096]KYK77559.1 N-glycosyltransferase [Agg
MSVFEILSIFVFVYPAGMAIYWFMAGTCYYLFKEGKLNEPISRYLPGEQVPMISLMVPCYNEGNNLDESIPHLLQLRYPNYELIFINDGSKDNTAEVIDRWAAKEPRITALHQENQGKASALNHGLTVAKGKYVACIDGDAVLDYYALDYMVQALEQDPKYAATTGNPRVRNRSTILGRLQVSEFSSIIGLIKRAQGLMGTIFTVSGVCCLFRKDVMEEIGGWSTNMITEDIDISWKIQIAGYNIMYEPRALCWVLMPESIKGLYKQRLRWAQGGAETIMKYFPKVWHWRNRRLWPMYIEYFATVIWAFLWVLLAVIALIQKYIFDISIENMGLFETNISIMFFAFFLQCLLSLYIDSRYERNLLRYGLSCIWYPYVYWLLNTVTLLVGIPKAIFRNKSKFAVWTSPDRGV